MFSVSEVRLEVGEPSLFRLVSWLDELLRVARIEFVVFDCLHAVALRAFMEVSMRRFECILQGLARCARKNMFQVLGGVIWLLCSTEEVTLKTVCVERLDVLLLESSNAVHERVCAGDEPFLRDFISDRSDVEISAKQGDVGSLLLGLCEICTDFVGLD